MIMKNTKLNQTITSHLLIYHLIFYSFQFHVGNGSNDEREFFNGHITDIQAKTPFFGKTDLFQPEMQFHYDPLKERQFVVLAEIFFHDDKLKIAYDVIFFQAFI